MFGRQLLDGWDGTPAVAIIVLGIFASEGLLFVGETWLSIWGHFLTLLFCVMLLNWGEDRPVVQAFALVPLFRLVNLGMPVFFTLTLYWFPLIYGPLIPAVMYVDSVSETVTVPFGWTRGLLLTPVAVILGAVFASVETAIIQSESLIPAWNFVQLGLITVVMVGFVGFVEEYLFRGLLQGALAAEYGRWPGLLIASAVFGMMHSGYGLPEEILFAASIGFLFGLIYEYLDSLVFITFAHGFLNVFVFAVYPIHGSFVPL